MSGYEKDLTMPPVFGGSGSPAHTPPGQQDLELPPVFNGSVPGMGMPTEKPLVLPPVL